MIKINSPCRVKWDLFVMMLAVINCLLIPFEIAFKPNSSEDYFLLALNTGIDIAFLADIVINFRTSYVSNKSGEQIIETKRIFRNYCMGRFWLDLAATIPFDRIYSLIAQQSQQLFNLFGLLKVLRVMRLQSIINNMNIREQLKMTLKIFNFCFLLVLYVHIVACIWYYIVRQNMAWVPPLDFMWYQIYDEYGTMNALGDTSNIYEANVWHKYWISVYHSVLMLTGNEVGPRTTLQACFAGLTILLGAIINAYIFGHMAVLITSLQKNSSLFQERLDQINTSMKNMHISKKIQRRVMNYLLFTQSNQHHRDQLNQFLKHLSPSLQNEVLHFFFEDVLRRNPVIKDESNQFHSTLVKQLEIDFYQPDDILIQQGQPEKDAVYFLVKGACTVNVRDYRSGKSNFVRTLRSSTLFGEVALLFNCKRTATVKSINYSIVAKLERSKFQFICTQFPELIQKLKREFNSQNDPWRSFMRNILKNVSYFQFLPPYILNELFTTLRDESVKAGRIIAKQGDPCQSIIFITKGEVQVCTTSCGSTNLICFDTLKQGAHFGQFWALTNSNYNFTVRAKNDALVHFLPVEVMEALASREPILQNRIQIAVEDIKQANSFGGIQCDIKHRPSKLTFDKPLKKFQRTIQRMLKFANLRKKSFMKSSSVVVTEQELDKMPDDGDDILKKFTSQMSSVSRSSQSVFHKFMTRQFTNLHKKNTLLSHGCESHRNDGYGEEVQTIKEELKQLRFMMKAIMGHLKINITNDRARSPERSPRRKNSSFSRMVARDLAQEQERRLTEIAMRRSNRMFGSPFPQMNTEPSTHRSQPPGISPTINIAMAAKKSLNSLAFNKVPDSHRLRIPKSPVDELSLITQVTEVKKNTWFNDKQPKKSTQKLIQEMEDLVGKMTPQPDSDRATPYSQYHEKEQVNQRDIRVAQARNDNGVEIQNDYALSEDFSEPNFNKAQQDVESSHRRVNSLHSLLE